MVNPAWSILVPLATAVLQLFALRRIAAQRALALAGSAVHLGVALAQFTTAGVGGEIVVEQVGGWGAPVGIVLVADALGATMVLIAAFVGLCGVVFALRDASIREEVTGFHPLYQILIAGTCGAFLTGDLFNLYVFFEIILMASFVLLAMGGRPAQLEGALKYVILNILASFVFLIGLGILYGKTGTLNMADLAARATGAPGAAVPTSAVILLLLAFATKAGVFPLFLWLPPSYPTPGHTVSAVFAGLLTKVGVYALLRVFVLVLGKPDPWVRDLLLAAGVLTMVAGITGAVCQMEIRRILSFHIISQIGYMVVAIALMTPAAVAAAVFYTCHHIIVKTNLFFVGGIIDRSRGTTELRRLGGLLRASPLLAVLFLVPALSLGGIPPLSGFFAKWLVIRSAVEIDAWVTVTAALVVGLFTLYSMTKIWAAAFWQDPPEPEETEAGGDEEDEGTGPMPSTHAGESRWPLFAPVVAMAAVTLLLGFFPEPLTRLSMRAAGQLLDPAAYIEAVLGTPR